MIMLKIITRSYHISLCSLLKMVIVNVRISNMIEYVFHVFLWSIPVSPVSAVTYFFVRTFMAECGPLMINSPKWDGNWSPGISLSNAFTMIPSIISCHIYFLYIVILEWIECRVFKHIPFHILSFLEISYFLQDGQGEPPVPCQERFCRRLSPIHG